MFENSLESELYMIVDAACRRCTALCEPRVCEPRVCEPRLCEPRVNVLMHRGRKFWRPAFCSPDCAPFTVIGRFLWIVRLVADLAV